MPRIESISNSTSRAKSTPPGSSSPPSSPHRVRLPATPAAVSRPNPLDLQRSTPGSKKAPAEEAPAKLNAAVAADKGSQSQSQPRIGVKRSASGSAASPTGVSAASGTGTGVKAKEEEEKPPVDMGTFEQILELDEEDDSSFSKGIIDNYYEQVDSTFNDMSKALVDEDTKKLSDLGHFLKGSSAALGVTKVQATCETIQHYGKLKEEDGKGSLEKQEALKRITALVERAKVEFQQAKGWFGDFFAKRLEAEKGKEEKADITA